MRIYSTFNTATPNILLFYHLLAYQCLKKPQKLQPWNGVLNGTVHGPVCPQVVVYAPLTDSIFQSEDCLYLNIHTPVQVSQCVPICNRWHSVWTTAKLHPLTHPGQCAPLCTGIWFDQHSRKWSVCILTLQISVYLCILVALWPKLQLNMLACARASVYQVTLWLNEKAWEDSNYLTSDYYGSGFAKSLGNRI